MGIRGRLLPDSALKIPVLEGQLLTFVELLGLPTVQLEAAKSEIRNKVWGFFNKNSWWICDDIAADAWNNKKSREHLPTKNHIIP